MAFELMKLPYAKDALAPTISAETIEYHYGKHHAAYVNKLNAAIEGTPLAEKDLVSIIAETCGKQPGVFNNAAQVWNHDFYWLSMAPNGGGAPAGKVAEWIDRSFGNFATFKEKFSAAAAGVFGSGWAWVVKDGDKLVIETTANADTPVAHGKTPVLTIDVWEHAYYVDYRNARPKYIEAFWNVVNWDHVGSLL
ncbi:MAG: superoxide dismutase [Deltaproteobacteria bacterium]|nr:MAG: superoxide dismutase [Deltaproteobacteria bacterium]